MAYILSAKFQLRPTVYIYENYATITTRKANKYKLGRWPIKKNRNRNVSFMFFVENNSNTAMIPYMVAQRIMSRRERIAHQQAGIEQAKKDGKYAGRKPTPVDENVLRQVVKELDEGIITIEEAMKRTKINSRSTFYRKLRNL